MNNRSGSVADKKLQTKDLIFAGAFGAIYLVLTMIVVLGSAMVPILYVLSPLIVGAVCGSVYMLCTVKVRKFGAALILGVLFALVCCSSSVPGLIAAIACALVAELIIMLGKYKSRKMYMLSFVVFNVNMACPFMLLLYAKDMFLTRASSYYGDAYRESLSALLPDGMFFGLVALALVGGVIGAAIAGKLSKKHFEKAGIA